MAAAAPGTAPEMQHGQLSGFLAGMPVGRSSLHYSALCGRMGLPDAGIAGCLVRVSCCSTPVMLLADSSGLQQCNCGHWIRGKWKAGRGFAKIHFLQMPCQEDVAVAVAGDRTCGSPVPRELPGTVVVVVVVVEPQDGRRRRMRQSAERHVRQKLPCRAQGDSSQHACRMHTAPCAAA